MVLAAGNGTRLRPLTDNCPKCLMPLAGRPLIDWTLTWLRGAGVEGCVINLHYLPDMVREYVGDGVRYGLRIEYSFEPELLGTAGAVRKVANFFDEPFYVIYSDNFSQWDLRKLKTVHEENGALATVAVHWREDVTQSGVVEISDESRIVGFVEKPSADVVTSHFVNAGFYYLEPSVFDYIPQREFCDFAYDVFPAMLKAGERLYAVKMDEPIIGIDTLEAYEKADKLAENLKKQLQSTDYADYTD